MVTSNGTCDQTVTISIEDYTKLMRDSIELEYQKKWAERVSREKESDQVRSIEHNQPISMTKKEIDSWKDENRKRCRRCLGSGCPTCNG